MCIFWLTYASQAIQSNQNHHDCVIVCVCERERNIRDRARNVQCTSNASIIFTVYQKPQRCQIKSFLIVIFLFSAHLYTRPRKADSFGFIYQISYLCGERKPERNNQNINTMKGKLLKYWIGFEKETTKVNTWIESHATLEMMNIQKRNRTKLWLCCWNQRITAQRWNNELCTFLMCEWKRDKKDRNRCDEVKEISVDVRS